VGVVMAMRMEKCGVGMEADRAGSAEGGKVWSDSGYSLLAIRYWLTNNGE
jgi:hypothetical protein